MELNRHKIWKPWEEKSHKLWSKTQNQKTRLKAPQRVAEKNFSGPTYDTSISHLDPMIFNCHHIIKKFRMKWNGDNWTIQSILDWQMREVLYQFKMYHKILVTRTKLCVFTKIIINQSIIRCNYTDKISYWK